MAVVSCSSCGLSREVGKRCAPCRKASKRKNYLANQESRTAYSRAYYAEHREDILSRIADKRRSNPEKKRAQEKAWRDANREAINARRRARHAQNPEIVRAAQRRWCILNPDKARSKWRRHYLKNPRGEYERACRYRVANRNKVALWQRQREARRTGAAGKVSPVEWDAIVNRQRGKCARCKTKCALTMDHIIPLSKGGSNYAFNIQGLCRSCNSSKNARLDRAPNTHCLIRWRK